MTRPALAAVPAGSWARFTPEGDVIAAHQDGSLRRFDPTRHLPSEPLALASAADDPRTPRLGAVAASPDGTTGAWGDPDGYLHLWNHVAGAPLGEPVPAHRSGVARVEFSPDGRLVATVTNPDGGPSEGFNDDSRTVRLWDAGTGQLVRVVRTDHEGFVRALAFSPDGTLLATGADPTIYYDTPDDPGSGPTVGVWDVRTGEPVGTPMTGQPVTALAFHPDGVTLAAGGRDGTVWQWDPVAGAELTAPISGHTGEIRALRFSADGEVFASGGAGDNRVRLWVAGTAESLAEALEGHESPVTSIDFAPDDTSLVSTDEAGMLRLWDVDPARVGEPFFDRTAERTLVAYQPDGAILAVAGWDGMIQLWRDGAEGFRLDEGVILAEQGQIRALAFDPSGDTLATGGDGSVRLWDPTTGRLRHHLDDPAGAVRSVAFSPDGDRLAAVGDGGVHLWQTDPPRLEWTIPADEASFTAVAFAPTGASLVGGDRAGDIYEWDPVDGAPIRRGCPGTLGRSPE